MLKTDSPQNHAKLPFAKGSLIFAPMEGITDAFYREIIHKNYPEWDALCCDFLRVPNAGNYPLKYFNNHIGKYFEDKMSHLMFQILTSPTAFTEEVVNTLTDLKIPWLDLNIGCPSGTVVRKKGGSYWLSIPQDLKKLLELIRKKFPGFFSVKMRIGLNNTDFYEELLKIIEGEGADAITVHGRTRLDLYKAKAKWEFIGEAVQKTKLPIIGNGDLWSVKDIKNMFAMTGCHSVMVARGALKAPWIARQFKKNLNHQNETIVNQKELKEDIAHYLKLIIHGIQANSNNEFKLITKIKELSRYLFEDLEDGTEIKRSIYLSQNWNELQFTLKKIFN